MKRGGDRAGGAGKEENWTERGGERSGDAWGEIKLNLISLFFWLIVRNGIEFEPVWKSYKVASSAWDFLITKRNEPNLNALSEIP